MTNPLRKVDDFLLDLAERFSHFMQRTFGTRAVDLERATIALALAFDVAYVVANYSRAVTVYMKIALLLAHSMVWVAQALRLYRTRQDRELTELRERYGLANGMKAIGSNMRMLALGMSLLMWTLGALYFLFWVSMVVSIYFGACDNLPPGESRVRKFLNALRASRLVPVRTS